MKTDILSLLSRLLPDTATFSPEGVLHIASNYNLVPRPAVLLVDEQKVQVMDRRETYADIVLRHQDFDIGRGSTSL
jgi:hypothetical protein